MYVPVYPQVNKVYHVNLCLLYCCIVEFYSLHVQVYTCTGADPGFQVRGGAHLKKSAEGGAKIFGVFRVKSHDFTQKNPIFSNCGGRQENLWGISCEKSRFYAKNSYFFPIAEGGTKICGVFRVNNHDFTPKNPIFSNFRGARAGFAPLWIRPCTGIYLYM